MLIYNSVYWSIKSVCNQSLLVVNRNSTLLRAVRAVCYIATDDMVGCTCVMELDGFHMFKKLLHAQTSTIPINSMTENTVHVYRA